MDCQFSPTYANNDAYHERFEEIEKIEERMLMGVKIDLLEFILHLYKAVSIPRKERREDDKSVHTPLQPLSTKKMSQKMTRWTDTKK